MPLLPPTTTSFCPVNTVAGAIPPPMPLLVPWSQLQSVLIRLFSFRLGAQEASRPLHVPSLVTVSTPHTVKTGNFRGASLRY